MEKQNSKLCKKVRDLGSFARQCASEIPEGEERDMAWAFFASAITGVAMNDGDPATVLRILQATVVGMTGANILQAHLDTVNKQK
jgi:hypothetical protein